MLPKRQRLTHTEIARAGQEGRRLKGDGLMIVYTQSEETKVAVVVSKKTAKSAVDRHRIKRRVYNALRPALAEFPQPLHLLVIVSPRHAESSLAELRTALSPLLARLHNSAASRQAQTAPKRRMDATAGQKDPESRI